MKYRDINEYNNQTHFKKFKIKELTKISMVTLVIPFNYTYFDNLSYIK